MSFIHKGAGDPHQHDSVAAAVRCTATFKAVAQARASVAAAAQAHVDATTDIVGKLDLLIARYGHHVIKPGGTEAYDGEDAPGGVAEDVFWKRVYAAREADTERRAYELKMARGW